MADISGSNTASSQIADGSDQITLMPNPLAQSERQEDRGRLWDDDLQRYVLQKVSMSSVGASLAPKVFMTPLAGTPERSVEGLSLEAGNKLGFNTYANSFFAGYWERYSTIRAVSLSGVMHGSGFLHLFKSTPSGDTQKIGKFPIGTLGQEDVFHIHFNLFEYLPSDGGAGRYYFDLEAGSDVVFKKIAFCAFDPPVRSPTLSLGICTYRKEEYVTKLALNLQAYLKETSDILTDVYFVNNDRASSDLGSLRDIAGANPALNLVEQGNIGGAGGFARSLHESMSSSSSDYHVFMDDDVFVDPEMFQRLHAFLSYSSAELVVGGQMFNMQHMTYLYEGGARLDYWGFLEKVGENIDMGEHNGVGFFDQVRDVDYNAWWFACVPKSAAEKLGFPLNIFIRGDDFEYGLRLKAAGIPTVSLPGLFVWHEPFEEKTTSWLDYYNWRNRLIVSSVHEDPEIMGVIPADMLRDILVTTLAAKAYSDLLAIGAAVVDFLLGPQHVLSSDAEVLHARVTDLFICCSGDEASVKAALTEQLARLQGCSSQHQIVCMSHSQQLAGRKRSRLDTAWLGAGILPVLDELLKHYEQKRGAAKEQWKAKALDLSSRRAWEKLYWKN